MKPIMAALLCLSFASAQNPPARHQDWRVIPDKPKREHGTRNKFIIIGIGITAGALIGHFTRPHCDLPPPYSGHNVPCPYREEKQK